MSQDLGGFREVLKHGAFDRAIRERQTVRALVNHDPNQLLGLTTAGTLRLATDSTGLIADIDPPDTTHFRDLAAHFGRNEVMGMSFAFIVRKDDWSTTSRVRRVLDLDLIEVSVLTMPPAYSATSAALRSLNAVTRKRWERWLKVHEKA